VPVSYDLLKNRHTFVRLVAAGSSHYASSSGHRCARWGLEEENRHGLKKPVAKLIACGMEINMYGPSEDDRKQDDVI
jgi:hypothetical protein